VNSESPSHSLTEARATERRARTHAKLDVGLLAAYVVGIAELRFPPFIYLASAAIPVALYPEVIANIGNMWR
jgi:hypothetical protein